MGDLFQYLSSSNRQVGEREQEGRGWMGSGNKGREECQWTRDSRAFTRVPFLRATINADWRLDDGNPGRRE